MAGADSRPIPPAFRVDVRRLDRAIHVAVSGELDMLTGPQLQSTLDELVTAGGQPVVLDLRALEFVGSTGISIVMRLTESAREHGVEVALVRGTPSVQRVLEIAGLEAHIPFIDASDPLLG